MADQPITFSRSCLKKMIEMYREHPVLWKVHSKKKDFKAAKDEAMKKITALAQQHNPRINRVHVLKKIESLRACHRKERRKVDMALKKNEVYTPTLWYYDSLAFLNGKKTKQPSLEENDGYYEQDQNSDVDDDEEIKRVSPFHKEEFLQHQYTSSSHTIVIPEASTFSVHRDQKLSSPHADEYDAIGINVAAKLRGLPTNMRILGEKLINEVLYQAQMNNLTPSSVIVNPDPFKNEC